MRIASNEMNEILKLANEASSSNKIRELSQADRKILSLVLKGINQNKGEVDIKKIADFQALEDFKARLQTTSNRTESGTLKSFGKGIGNILGFRRGSTGLQDEIKKTFQATENRNLNEAELSGIYTRRIDYYKKLADELRDKKSFKEITDAFKEITDAIDVEFNVIDREIKALKEKIKAEKSKEIAVKDNREERVGSRGDGVKEIKPHSSFDKEIKLLENFSKFLLKERDVVIKKQSEFEKEKANLSPKLQEERLSNFKIALADQYSLRAAKLQAEFTETIAKASNLKELKKLQKV